jgi:hypothetical protein
MIINKIIRQPLESQLSIPPSLEPRPKKLRDRIYENIPQRSRFSAFSPNLTKETRTHNHRTNPQITKNL